MLDVFKKIPGSDVTVTQLCSLNETLNAVKYLNKNDVLVRRKDLSGVHFRIGYLSNHSLFYEENQAKKFFFSNF